MFQTKYLVFTFPPYFSAMYYVASQTNPVIYYYIIWTIMTTWYRWKFWEISSDALASACDTRHSVLVGNEWNVNICHLTQFAVFEIQVPATTSQTDSVDGRF